MANKGFRRSLMGFNREDVLNYISSVDKKNTATVKSLNGEIKDLTDRNLFLTKEIEVLNDQLKIYKDKEEEIITYNLNDNEIIYEKNKDVEGSIASLTKIMTTIVAIENPSFDSIPDE